MTDCPAARAPVGSKIEQEVARIVSVRAAAAVRTVSSYPLNAASSDYLTYPQHLADDLKRVQL